MKMENKIPLIIILTAPSGAGKTTLRQLLLKDFPCFYYSVSCTTRKPRPGEIDGIDYHFITREKFEEAIKQNKFLEYANVHGELYGTLLAPIESALKSGKNVLMDIDVQGAQSVRNFLKSNRLSCKAKLVDIFITVPKLETLKKRLIARGKDSELSIETRLKRAEEEIKLASEFKYVIVNDILEECYSKLKKIIEHEER